MRDPRIAAIVRRLRRRFERSVEARPGREARDVNVISYTGWGTWWPTPRREHRDVECKKRAEQVRQKKALDELARLTEEMGGYE